MCHMKTILINVSNLGDIKEGLNNAGHWLLGSHIIAVLLLNACKGTAKYPLLYTTNWLTGQSHYWLKESLGTDDQHSMQCRTGKHSPMFILVLNPTQQEKICTAKYHPYS